MEDILGKFVSILLILVFLFIIPLFDIFERTDDISNTLLVQYTMEFNQSVRNKGYLSSDMYTKYLYELATTGNTYKIELEHIKSIPYLESDGSLEYYEVGYYNSDIIDTLNSGKKYYFSKGDMFFVKIKNTNPTTSQLLQGDSSIRHIINYGGIIRNEGN